LTLSTSPGTGLRSRLPSAGLRSPVARVVLAVLLSLLLVAVLVWLAAEALARRDGGVASDTGAASEAVAREEVMSVSRQFALRVLQYGPDDLADGKMTEYQERIREVVSTSGEAKLDQMQQGIVQLVDQYGQSQEVEVYGIGVAELSEDSAQALVTGAFRTTWYEGRKRETSFDPIQFRWRVDLVEVDGEWLVDDFAPVGSAAGPEEVPKP